jgi:hypothetical protein
LVCVYFREPPPPPPPPRAAPPRFHPAPLLPAAAACCDCDGLCLLFVGWGSKASFFFNALSRHPTQPAARATTCIPPSHAASSPLEPRVLGYRGRWGPSRNAAFCFSSCCFASWFHPIRAETCRAHGLRHGCAQAHRIL